LVYEADMRVHLDALRVMKFLEIKRFENHGAPLNGTEPALVSFNSNMAAVHIASIAWLKKGL